MAFLMFLGLTFYFLSYYLLKINCNQNHTKSCPRQANNALGKTRNGINNKQRRAEEESSLIILGNVTKLALLISSLVN